MAMATSNAEWEAAEAAFQAATTARDAAQTALNDSSATLADQQLETDRLTADSTAMETARASGEATNGAQELPPCEGDGCLPATAAAGDGSGANGGGDGAANGGSG